MNTKESDAKRPQREADRRKRQAAALKANLKRRKVEPESDNPDEKDDSST
jgi:hypothetical protein